MNFRGKNRHKIVQENITLFLETFAIKIREFEMWKIPFGILFALEYCSPVNRSRSLKSENYGIFNFSNSRIFVAKISKLGLIFPIIITPEII